MWKLKLDRCTKSVSGDVNMLEKHGFNRPLHSGGRESIVSNKLCCRDFLGQLVQEIATLY